MSVNQTAAPRIQRDLFGDWYYWVTPLRVTNNAQVTLVDVKLAITAACEGHPNGFPCPAGASMSWDQHDGVFQPRPGGSSSGGAVSTRRGFEGATR